MPKPTPLNSMTPEKRDRMLEELRFWRSELDNLRGEDRNRYMAALELLRDAIVQIEETQATE